MCRIPLALHDMLTPRIYIYIYIIRQLINLIFHVQMCLVFNTPLTGVLRHVHTHTHTHTHTLLQYFIIDNIYMIQLQDVSAQVQIWHKVYYD